MADGGVCSSRTISRRAYVVLYSEDDLAKCVSKRRCDYDIALEEYGLWGAEYAELILTKIL